MAMNEDVNSVYIADVIDFMNDLLTKKEKKLSLFQRNMNKQWEDIANNHTTYLAVLKTSANLSEVAFFNLLLAISLELSYEVHKAFHDIFKTSYATLFLAQQVYHEFHPTNHQDIMSILEDNNHDLFYDCCFEKKDYMHNRKLVLRPWILPYIRYGGVMHCRYVYFIFVQTKKRMQEEERTSFVTYANEGMKAILTHDDEVELLTTLHGLDRTTCVIDLAYIPYTWNTYTIFSFCSFYAKVLQCAFFIRLSEETQKQYLKSALASFPFTFLIVTNELLPPTIPILHMPYIWNASAIIARHAFVKEYGKEEKLPQFIGEENFLKRIDEFMDMVKYKNKIHSLLSSDTTSKGISALFYGPSGNGKTLSARYLAQQLNKRLWKIELSDVLDKYIGESEKHLETIFCEAEQDDVILLFDEADTLFTKRTNVKDANDRYANAITSYLLQRMENFSGIMILTSNFLQNFDDAFLRRIHCILRFYEASSEQRFIKWQSVTRHIEVATNIDWKEIANIKLSFARIDQCMFMACSFMVSQQQSCLYEHHIKKAIAYELEKHGELPPKEWENGHKL